MTEIGTATLHQRRLAAMRARLIQDVYLSVTEVATRWGVSRTTVECLPLEILPYHDVTPLSRRSRRRYNPAEVLAAEVRLRHWELAKQRDQGERYLNMLREELAHRDQRILAEAAQLEPSNAPA